jgi:hypothetical protein
MDRKFDKQSWFLNILLPEIDLQLRGEFNPNGPALCKAYIFVYPKKGEKRR